MSSALCPMDINQSLAKAIKNPDAALLQLDRKDCEDSLAFFIKRFWHILEPGRPFVHGWHLDVMCAHLMAVTRGEIQRLLLNVPPGTMKSLLVNVFWPAWEWGPGKKASYRFVKGSYSSTLTVRDNRKMRRLVQSDLFRSMWPEVVLTGDQNNKVKFENNHTGFSLATSIGGVGTGERGDRVIVDDPHNVKEGESEAVRASTLGWFTEVVPTRMQDPIHSSIIVIMQRVHEQDVSGYILEKDLGYEHVMLPMEFEPERRCYTGLFNPDAQTRFRMRYLGTRQRWLPDDWVPRNSEDIVLAEEFNKARSRTVWCWDKRRTEDELLFEKRFPRDVVERDKKVMGDYATAGQLQQRPSPRGGLMFNRQSFPIIPAVPHNIQRVVRHWDLASTKHRIMQNTNARTAGVLLGQTTDKRFVVLDLRTLQDEGEEVEKLIVQTAKLDYEQWGSKLTISLPQDPGQAGKVQAKDYVKKLWQYKVHAEPETGDKITRAEPVASQARVGNILLLSGTWNAEFLDEVSKFPTGRRKDIVDALSGAYGRFVMQASGNVISLFGVRGY